MFFLSKICMRRWVVRPEAGIIEHDKVLTPKVKVCKNLVIDEVEYGFAHGRERVLLSG